jgi:hypothetical protein
MNTYKSFSHQSARVTVAALLAAASVARADHGPGTSGGGASTQSGETLKAGKFAVEFREDYTEFQDLSQARIDAKAMNAGSIDLLDRSFLSTASLSYGVVDNVQFGLTLGHYIAVNAREAEYDPDTGDTGILTFDPNGVTDLWLTSNAASIAGRLAASLFSAA